MRKIIKLSEPFEMHGRKVTEIALNEPKGWDAANLGEPRVFVYNSNATLGGYFVEMPEVIGKYLERCVDHELGADVLRMLSLADALELKQALFGFFIEAEETIARKRSGNSASAPTH